jgi:hypothetical protein
MRGEGCCAAVSVKRSERDGGSDGGCGGRKKKLNVVTKPFRRWLIVIYKQALALVRQAFKMVVNLEGRGGAADDLALDNVIRD